MKSSRLALLSLALTAAPLSGFAAEQLIPAGSLIQCTVSEPKLSSKTADVGDPVLCRVSHVEQYGRSTLPYNSYLVGRFEDYKDPGHLVGKGWMELRFDRMVIQPDTVIPIAAKVVALKGYNVDRQGRILGKGHPVRDTLEWMVPVLWPIDLINLPRRGPRPVLKGESRLTLKIMDDLGVPMREQAQAPPQLNPRAPVSYVPAPMAPQPIVQTYIQPVIVPGPPVAVPYGIVMRRYPFGYPAAPGHPAPGYPASAFTNPGYPGPRYAAPQPAPRPYPNPAYAPSGYPAAEAPAQAYGPRFAAATYTSNDSGDPLLAGPPEDAEPQKAVSVLRNGEVYRTVYR